MKTRRALLLTITVVLALCAACGVWLHRERQQYALNRQLIEAMMRSDAKTALVLVNAGADPNTQAQPIPVPTLRLLLNELLHHTPPPLNDSPNALMIACGMGWNIELNGLLSPPLAEEESAPFEENLSLLRAMLAHGVNVNARGTRNHTALHYAVFCHRVHTAELLLQHDADANVQNDWGVTPLVAAIDHAAVNIVPVLLAHGANPNIPVKSGWTALHFAVHSDDGKSLIPQLLAHGADLNLRNSFHESPIDVARIKRLDLIPLLLQHGAK